MKNRLKEILRFVLTGGVCTLIEYAALYALKTWLHWGAVAATPSANAKKRRLRTIRVIITSLKWARLGKARKRRKKRGKRGL